ncbi:GMC family oxidoreductase [Streptomyces sp. NBC_01728]|uniref:GMC family oxidoreductase n=1 Tax=unclassified Streptomyces TaxID=2593676 RepID=UPI00225209CB|nr:MULTISPECIES: GMC family oxidoreductase [unclassified Streptomyces]MCX4461409.1 GMC family oxidoreductase [Streptomyces sp. NBC_01719]MCX4490317.1 GMC family oxidoreductase [Streptomyces sp. NBC_01728]
MSGPEGLRWDAVVVGGGFAGSLVAKRLGDQGWRVLVLEAGHGAPGPEGGHSDAVEAYRTALLKVPNSPYRTSTAAPSPAMSDVGEYFVQNGPLPYGSGYLRANGGTGLAWTGLAPRMHPEDFRAGDFGQGRNWPLGYDDLEPYYRAAEREIGVAGDAEEQRAEVGLPFPDDYRFPMRAIPQSYLDQVMTKSLDGGTVRDPGVDDPVRLRVVTTPHARNGLPHPSYDDGAGYRPAPGPGQPDRGTLCQGYASCVPICPSQAKYTPLKTQARWGSSVTLVTQAVVTRVRIGADGRAAGVEYRSYRDDTAEVVTHSVDADLVVLAAHAIENAKLLLVSEAANSSDQVGRNLMDHPVLLTWGLMPQQVGAYRGPGSTSGLEGFRFGAARTRRAPFRVEIGNWGWTWALGPPDRRVAEFLGTGGSDGRGILGTELRRALGDRIGREFAFQFEMEQEADPANRVTVDPRRRDALGTPRPVIHYDLSDYVKRGIAAAKAVSDQLFELLGAEDHTRFEQGPDWPGYFEFEGRPYAYRAAGHGAGTHIMGDSPLTSVVDEWQRCWDHPNLYAVGCGSMPTVATSNPSLTMAALALRSSEEMHRDLLGRRRIASAEHPAPPAS